MRTHKLAAGTETGSLMNHLMSGNTAQIAYPGMGCTILHWTDRTAATVVECNGPDFVTVQDDIATRADKNGMSDAQSYTYSRNPNGPKRHFKRDRKGAWRPAHQNEAGRWVFDGDGGNHLLLGERRHYHDFGF